MQILLKLGLAPDHHDYPSLKATKEIIIGRAVLLERYKRDIPLLLGQRIDEVVATPFG